MMVSADLKHEWLGYLDECAPTEMSEFWNGYPDARSFYIDGSALNLANTDLFQQLVDRPDAALAACEAALWERAFPEVGRDGPRINARVRNLPEGMNMALGEIAAEARGHLIRTRASIKKVGDRQARIVEAHYTCGRCATVQKVEQHDTKLEPPLDCKKELGGCGRGAGAGTKFFLINEKSTYLNSRTMYLEELLEQTQDQPKVVKCILDDDLTDDILDLEVVVNAVVRIRHTKDDTIGQFYLQAVSVETGGTDASLELTDEDREFIDQLRAESDPMQLYVASFAPHIHGLEAEKEAMVLWLFNGVPKVAPDGITNVRGDFHILFPGDPSTAKSELVDFALHLLPKGLRVDGSASSGKGLTVIREKDDDGRWSYTLGAFPRCDRGHLIIDEFGELPKGEVNDLKQAMEQQVIDTAKAGLITGGGTLRSRCGVIGVMNPKMDRFDPYRSFAEQIDVPPAVLSRFGLIFVLRDVPETTTDKLISDSILDVHMGPDQAEGERLKPAIPPPLLRKIIHYARHHVRPRLTRDARQLLQAHYLTLRKLSGGDDSKFLIVARNLADYVRLSEASARARLSETVDMRDAERAVRLIRKSLEELFQTKIEDVDMDALFGKYSHSQRQRVVAIRRALERGPQTRSDLIEALRVEGIDPYVAQKDIERLERDGELVPMGDYIGLRRS